MSQVYHAIKPTFGLPQLPEPQFPADYELVAELDSNDIDEAFRLTNHIDQPWYENQGVKALKKARSTSVGDVIVIPTGTFRCATIGWEKLNDEPQSR